MYNEEVERKQRTINRKFYRASTFSRALFDFQDVYMMCLILISWGRNLEIKITSIAVSSRLYVVSVFAFFSVSISTYVVAVFAIFFVSISTVP